MSYICNSPKTNNNNIFTEKNFCSKKSEDERTVIVAPQSLPKFSINAELENSDIFQREVNANFCKKMQKQENSLGSLAFIPIAAAAILLVCGRK